MRRAKVTSPSQTDRVWREAGLDQFPDLAADAFFREERQRLRGRLAVFQGWTAWQLQEYLDAIAAFRAALDQGTGEPELDGWMLRHLLQRREDYLQEPINGAWPTRSLRLDPAAPGVLAEHDGPSRAPRATYEETTAAALLVLHRLLLAQPAELRRAAPLYFCYHPFIEPATGMVLAPIAAGSFLMGSPPDEPERFEDEGPQHRVTISRNFWMGIYPVTQQQYQAVMGDNPSHFKGENRPVESVSWDDAVAFCEKLTQGAAATGLVPERCVFRLPTEAEWEYCCRAGTETPTAFGRGLSSRQANFNGEYPYGRSRKGPNLNRTSDVGSYRPNAWGLYDMHGNVWEWCLDAAEWDGNVKTDTYVDRVTDPVCKVGRYRVYRGGSWFDGGGGCRSACRIAGEPGVRYDNLGFRVCLARSPAGERAVTETGEPVPSRAQPAGTASRSKSRRARRQPPP